MPDLYTRLAGSAQRSIRKFGAKGAIRRPGEPGGGESYNPEPGEPVDHPAHVVLIDFTNREIDGTRILATDRKALVEPGIGLEPTTADLLITADGATLTIIDVDLIRPATTTLLYTLQVRA